MTMLLRLMDRILFGVAVGSAASCVLAQNYPDKPVRLIVPIGAGGSSDVLARTVAQKLSESLGQSVVVDNRPGASSIIGHDIAAKSPPDGYTILLVSTSFVVNPSLYSKLPHDTLRDLTPITLLAVAPYFLTVHPSLPVKSPAELIALAKARPGARRTRSRRRKGAWRRQARIPCRSARVAPSP